MPFAIRWTAKIAALACAGAVTTVVAEPLTDGSHQWSWTGAPAHLHQAQTRRTTCKYRPRRGDPDYNCWAYYGCLGEYNRAHDCCYGAWGCQSYSDGEGFDEGPPPFGQRPDQGHGQASGVDCSIRQGCPHGQVREWDGSCIPCSQATGRE